MKLGRFYDWSEEEKAGYRADVEAALANNDLAELKKLRKNKRGGGQNSLFARPFFLMETER